MNWITHSSRSARHRRFRLAPCLLSGLFAAGLAGCQASPGGSAGDPDRDDDGLTTSDEEQLGTDPENPDTDGDGLWDGDEIDVGTSPLAADSDGDRIPDGTDPDPLTPGNGANTNTSTNDNEPALNLNDNTPDQPPGDDGSRAESEPNDSFEDADEALPTSSGQVTLQGFLSGGGDLDVFDFGEVVPGDVIQIQTTVLDDGAAPDVALFDDQFRLIALFPLEVVRGVEPYSHTVRHDSDACFLAISDLLDIATERAYELRATLSTGIAVPVPAAQTILLDFDGGVVNDPTAGPLSIGPLEAAAIDLAYQGQTEALKSIVESTFRENLADFDVEIFTTDDASHPTAPFSTIFVGHSDYFAFGLAQAVDTYNGNPGDASVVFANQFVEENFGRVLSLEELGTAIGNVAAHEMGHLLGLVHTADPGDLMDQESPALTLIEDQSYQESPLSFDVFPLGAQDALLLLAEILGLA